MKNRNNFLINSLAINKQNFFVILSFLFLGITSDLWSMEDGKNQDGKREFMCAVLNNEPWAVQVQKENAYAQQRKSVFEKSKDEPYNQCSIDREAQLDLIYAQNENRSTIWDHPDASDELREKIKKHNDRFLNQ